jgi:hypothetical protein
LTRKAVRHRLLRQGCGHFTEMISLKIFLQFIVAQLPIFSGSQFALRRSFQPSHFPISNFWQVLNGWSRTLN